MHEHASIVIDEFGVPRPLVLDMDEETRGVVKQRVYSSSFSGVVAFPKRRSLFKRAKEMLAKKYIRFKAARSTEKQLHRSLEKRGEKVRRGCIASVTSEEQEVVAWRVSVRVNEILKLCEGASPLDLTVLEILAKSYTDEVELS